MAICEPLTRTRVRLSVFVKKKKNCIYTFFFQPTRFFARAPGESLDGTAEARLRGGVICRRRIWPAAPSSRRSRKNQTASGVFFFFSRARSRGREEEEKKNYKIARVRMSRRPYLGGEGGARAAPPPYLAVPTPVFARARVPSKDPYAGEMRSIRTYINIFFFSLL